MGATTEAMAQTEGVTAPTAAAAGRDPSEEPNYDGFFDDVSNYDGTVDMRDADEVTVNVGANDGLSFGPAAVAVSSGTTVVWEWTGQGGDHNVSATDGEFESDTAGEEGHTFEHTFEEAGTTRHLHLRTHAARGSRDEGCRLRGVTPPTQTRTDDTRTHTNRTPMTTPDPTH